MISFLNTYRFDEKCFFQSDKVPEWKNAIYKAGAFLPQIQLRVNEEIEATYPTLELCRISQRELNNQNIVIVESYDLGDILLTVDDLIYVNEIVGKGQPDGIYIIRIYISDSIYYYSDPFCYVGITPIPIEIEFDMTGGIISAGLTFESHNPIDLWIDWGDGSPKQNFVMGTELSHTYPATQVYTAVLTEETGSKWYEIKELVADTANISNIELDDFINIEECNLNDNLLTSIGDINNKWKKIETLGLKNNLIPDSFVLTNKSSLVTCDIQNNLLTSIDLQNCINMNHSGVHRPYQNPNLVSLNLNGCISETRLNTENCPDLETVNIQGCKSLTRIHITQYSQTSKITSLDITQCPELLELYVANCKLVTLDFTNSQNLLYVVAQNNKITSVTSVNNLNSIDEFLIRNNELTGDIVLTNKASLTNVYIDNNNLTSINLSNNVNLDMHPSYSFLYMLYLEIINVENCSSLSVININESNNVNAINMDGCTALTTIDAEDASLGTLTFPAAPFSTEINLKSNAMTAGEVDQNLINIDGTGVSSSAIDISGTNAARTSTSDTAVSNLLSRGNTVTTN
jgi:hypothetical protein